MKKNFSITIIVAIIIGGGILTWHVSNDDTSNLVTPSPTTTTNTTDGTTVAFIGDQGLGSNAVAVLELIKAEGADMVLHQGDFDYNNDPDAWDQQITAVLGASFPYFASVGNHDIKAWDDYQKKLTERLALIEGAVCEGEYGVNSWCTYQGLFFVLSGIGTIGENHEEYITQALSGSDAPWKICSWHKNQTLMQLGGKGNEVGWEAYDICKDAGAIIATGHEHSYSRTHLMKSFTNQEVVNTSNTLRLSPGQTFAFVSGISGKSIRDVDNDLDENPWWASTYTSENDANHGALFCTFAEYRAQCYFKDIAGTIVDQFSLTTIQ